MEFFDEGIVPRDVRTPVMCDGFDMNTGEGLVERAECRGVKERVAEASGGEYQNATRGCEFRATWTRRSNSRNDADRGMVEPQIDPRRKTEAFFLFPNHAFRVKRREGGDAMLNSRLAQLPTPKP